MIFPLDAAQARDKGLVERVVERVVAAGRITDALSRIGGGTLAVDGSGALDGGTGALDGAGDLDSPVGFTKKKNTHILQAGKSQNPVDSAIFKPCCSADWRAFMAMASIIILVISHEPASLVRQLIDISFRSSLIKKNTQIIQAEKTKTHYILRFRDF